MTGQCKTCGQATSNCYPDDGRFGMCKCEVVKILQQSVYPPDPFATYSHSELKQVEGDENVDRLMRKETK